MKKKILIMALCLVAGMTAEALVQTSGSLDTEHTALEEQIREVNAAIAEYDGGIVQELAEMRREAPPLLSTMVEGRQQAEEDGVQIELVMPAVEPDPERAN